MRILHITRQFLPATGGIERVVYHLAKEQLAAGHEVGVLTLNRLFSQPDGTNAASPLAVRETIDDISIQRLAYFGSRRYAVAPNTLRYVGDFDLIHLHSTDFFLNMLASTKAVHHKPLVLTSHGLFFHTSFARAAKQAYFNTVLRWNLHSVDAIICVSDQDCRALRKITRSDKIHLIPNGIDWYALANTPVQNRDPGLLLAVGSLTQRKRYDRMLEVFAYLRQRHPSLRLVIVGADHGMLHELMEQAKRLDIARNVRFLGGVNDDTLHHYLAKSSILLSSSEYEAFGIAAVEAAIAGSIPIMQPLDAYRSIFPASMGDHLFTDYDDTFHAAETILSMVERTESERSQYAQRLRNHFQSFAWPAVAAKTETLYQAVLGTNLPFPNTA